VEVAEMISSKLLLVAVGSKCVVAEGRQHLTRVAKQQVQGELEMQERGHKLQKSVTY
jgi:hypothetical protein